MLPRAVGPIVHTLVHDAPLISGCSIGFSKGPAVMAAFVGGS